MVNAPFCICVSLVVIDSTVFISVSVLYNSLGVGFNISIYESNGSLNALRLVNRAI